MTTKEEIKYCHRFTASVDAETVEQVKYWARKNGISINDFLREAISHYIAYQNKDYDLPTLEAQRLNQIVDGMAVLSSNVSSLETTMMSALNSLISLTRGDSVYLDDDDGELDDE